MLTLTKFCDNYNTGDKQTVLVVSDFENECMSLLIGLNTDTT